MMANKAVRKKSEEIGISGLNSISVLETDIMKIVWEKEKTSVREVHEIMLRKEIEKKDKGFIPYTTVMSTMNTLAEKGLLKQDRSAKTYVYSAAVDKKELSKSIIISVLENLFGKPTKSLVSKSLDNSGPITEGKVKGLLKEIDEL